MKPILVATDGSESADRAVDFAADFAKRSGASLLIVNIIGGYGLPEDVLKHFGPAQHASLDERLQSSSLDLLAKAGDRASAHGVPTIELLSRKGDVAQTIIDLAQEKDAAAICLGKRGAGFVAGLLLGSVSQKLVSLASRPVFVIP